MKLFILILIYINFINKRINNKCSKMIYKNKNNTIGLKIKERILETTISDTLITNLKKISKKLNIIKKKTKHIKIHSNNKLEKIKEFVNINKGKFKPDLLEQILISYYYKQLKDKKIDLMNKLSNIKT